MFWLAFDPRRSNLGLVFGYVAIGLGLGLLLVLGLLRWLFDSGRDTVVKDGLFGQAEEIAQELRIDSNGHYSLTMHEPMQWAYRSFDNNLEYRVLNADGRVVLSSDGELSPLLPETNTTAGSIPPFFRIRHADAALSVGSYQFNRDGHAFTVQTARSDMFSALAAEAMQPAVFDTATVLALATFLVLLLATYLALRVALARIRSVSQAADSIQPENLAARLSLTAVPLELVPLVEAFNRALDRIAEGYRMQQRFVANAAHELKTPLTILRGRIDLRLQGTLREQLLQDVDHMARNVQQMLQLSQVEDIRNYRFGPVALRALAEEVVRSFEGLPLLAQRRLVVTGAESTLARADAAAVFMALRNLVDNAVKWSPAAGVVEVAVLADGYRVHDEGPGFDPRHRPLLFERFWRANASLNDSSGLGLSIVAEVARAHGGKVDATLGANGGSVFTVILAPAT
jgi:two-component system sensor histidine kinase QseC